MLTNGIIHYYCKVDKLNNKIFFKNLPEKNETSNAILNWNGLSY